MQLSESDRISVLLVCLVAYPVCGSLRLEVLDTNDGKALSSFCKKFEAPLLRTLSKAGRLVEDPSAPHLLLTFKSGRGVFLGLAEANNSAFWPMGVPRLKFPRNAPSRSTLKLEEAWHQFIPRGSGMSGWPQPRLRSILVRCPTAALGSWLIDICW